MRPALARRLAEIDPRAYARSRNHLDGAVTRLSPFISRGVLSTRAVFEHLRDGGWAWSDCEKLVQELAWRDFFQRVWQARGDGIDADLRRPQPGVRHHRLPTALPRASTGVEAIDRGIGDLVDGGYLHNHLRMYTAAVACNIGGAHWREPARWMYYHLHDGDWASNALSWQWVAGAFSAKKYFANQENINRYTGSRQRGTFLDADYEALEGLSPPACLDTTEPFDAVTPLPATPAPILDPHGPVFVYSYYNLDPHWHAGEEGTRVLLLEPRVFARYPVSASCLQWAQELGGDIPGLQVMVASFEELAALAGGRTVFKEHPLAAHWAGRVEPRDWLVPEVDGYFPSFFAYWKKVGPRLRAVFERG